jgi:hypothetical protein
MGVKVRSIHRRVGKWKMITAKRIFNFIAGIKGILENGYTVSIYPDATIFSVAEPLLSANCLCSVLSMMKS